MPSRKRSSSVSVRVKGAIRSRLKKKKSVKFKKRPSIKRKVIRKKKPSSKADGLQVMSASAVPVVKGQVIKQRGPIVNRGRGFHVRHSEYLEDIVATANFTTIIYNLNAGLIDSFPWLGGIAGLFETWLPHKLVFEFESFCASTTVCSVAMATQLDVEDVAFGSYEEMMGYQGAITGPGWKSFRHNCLRGGQKTLFTRTGTAAGDPRLYDYGNFTIATEKGTNTQLLGRLIVHYDIELFTPKITLAGAMNFWQSIGVGFLNTITTSMNSFAFQNATILSQVAPTNWASYGGSAITLTQVGTYLLECIWNPGGSLPAKIYESKTVACQAPLIVSADAKGAVVNYNGSVGIGAYQEQDASFSPQGGNSDTGFGSIVFEAVLQCLVYGATFALGGAACYLTTGGGVGSNIEGVIKLTLMNSAAALTAPNPGSKKYQDKLYLTAQAKKVYLSNFKMDLYGKSEAERKIIVVPDGWVHPSLPRDQKDGKGLYINPIFNKGSIARPLAIRPISHLEEKGSEDELEELDDLRDIYPDEDVKLTRRDVSIMSDFKKLFSRIRNPEERVQDRSWRDADVERNRLERERKLQVGPIPGEKVQEQIVLSPPPVIDLTGSGKGRTKTPERRNAGKE